MVAKDIAIPSKNQTIPVCSFTVMRTEFFVLFIDTKKLLFDLQNEIRGKLKENVYYSNSIEEALEIIDKKKLNKMKLIISFDDYNLGKSIIIGIREITQLNFVCLVYSNSKNITQLPENVLFTYDFEDINLFAKMDLEQEHIYEFAVYLQNKYNTIFCINEKDLVQFYDSSQYKKTPPNTKKRPVLNNKDVCGSFQENVEKSDLLYYSGFEYHRNCLKCSVCQKKIEPDKNSQEFICLTPGMFICNEDYAKYQETGTLPENVLQEYKEKIIRNLINEIIRPIVTNEFNEYLIENDMIDNSYQLNKNYKYFVPTVTFHFSIEKIDIKKLIEKLPNVTKIEDLTFKYCFALKRVSFESSNSLTSIGIQAFYGCESLSRISIPSSVISIGKEAFNSCSILMSINFPICMTTIE